MDGIDVYSFFISGFSFMEYRFFSQWMDSVYTFFGFIVYNFLSQVFDSLYSLEDWGEKVYHVGAPKSTNEEESGSIRRKQAIGAKRGASVDISEDLLGNSPNTSKTHTRKMQRGASWARRRLPICTTEKVQCLHCDALTFRSRDSNVGCCKNCGASCHHPHMSHNHGFRFYHGCLGALVLSISNVQNILCSMGKSLSF